MSFPVTRPVGRALIVGNAACRGEIVRLLEPQGYACVQSEDPYAAMLEMSRNRLAYQSLILSLTSLYREELLLISTVKRRLPHIEIWLAQTDGRAAALAEGVRLGADGLVADDGSLHRMAVAVSAADASGASLYTGTRRETEEGAAASAVGGGDGQAANDPETSGSTAASSGDLKGAAGPSAEAHGTTGSSMAIPDVSLGEPVLTADELRALLQDQASAPPSATD